MGHFKVPVLMLPMSLDIGGAETHVVGLAKSIQTRGWKVLVASFGGRRVQDLEKAGIPHKFAPLNSRSPIQMLRAYKIVSRIVDEYKIGLIHAHARIPAWLSEKISRKKGIPLLMTYHYTCRSGFPWKFFSRPGDLTIAVSEDIKQYIVREFGFRPEKIFVIPNGIDLDIFRPRDLRATIEQRRLLGVSETSHPVILYASRLQGDLTQAALVAQKAVLSLVSKYPNITLLIAGDGEGFSAVRKGATKINKITGKETIKCLGFVLDTPPMYTASDVVVGMSRVALEAMASGKPAIIFGPGGIFGPVTQDLINLLEERNYTSRNAPLPLSSEILASHIDSLVSDPVRSQELGRFGRRLVAQRHSMNIVAQETEKLYFRLLQ